MPQNFRENELPDPFFQFLYVKFKANIQILKIVKTMTKIPIVVVGVIKSNNYKKLLLNKANFLAISGYIWNNKKLNPFEAANKLK